MKKKILSLCLVAVLALAAIGGTLAYFTDTDEAVNAFVIGEYDEDDPTPNNKVDVDVDEEFEQNSGLMPGVEVNKDVAIKVSEDTVESYVWYDYLVPTELVDVLEIKFANGSTYPAEASDATKATGTWGEPVSQGTEEVDGVSYTKYRVKFSATVNSGEYTPYHMDSVTLKSSVDYDFEDKYYYYTDTSNNKVEIEYAFTNNKVDIIVRGYAIQAAGFEAKDDKTAMDVAIEAYYAQN